MSFLIRFLSCLAAAYAPSSLHILYSVFCACAERPSIKSRMGVCSSSGMLLVLVLMMFGADMLVMVLDAGACVGGCDSRASYRHVLHAEPTALELQQSFEGTKPCNDMFEVLVLF